MNRFFHKQYCLLILVFSLFIPFPSVIFAANMSPVGYWQTMDDHTHQAASIVKIWEEKGVLYGKIEKIFRQGGNKPTDRCIRCPGEFYNKPIEGLTILWGFRQINGEWRNGRILDPKIGKIYRCKLRVYGEGKYLHVRGYIGISLLGRSQTWVRVFKKAG